MAIENEKRDYKNVKKNIEKTITPRHKDLSIVKEINLRIQIIYI